ncbi:MAG: GGDEF domain-containing protein [Planctomycetota bacterium]|jgi:diguanylate cyclase (GGDEF)-like protein
MEEVAYQILFVEDSHFIREKVSPLLRGGRLARFVIHEASSLSEGLPMLRNVEADAVLLDLGLPDSTGLNTLRTIRKAVPHVAVVVLTGDDSDSTVMEALREGAQDYLLKEEVSGPLLQRTLRYAIERMRLEEELRHRANFDSLTGVYSRPCLMEKLERSITESRESGVPLTLCLCDLDQLKVINDTHGHREGDRVLETFGKLVSDNIGWEGFAGRYGGDEFLIVLPAVDAGRAEELVEGVRRALAGHSFELEGGGRFRATSTFGLASLSDAIETSRALIECADTALYDGKKDGHDRVVRGQ